MSRSRSLPARPVQAQGSIVLGTGLAFASLILLPAAAAHFGISATLTGAMRIALMRASNRVVRGKQSTHDTSGLIGFSCH